MAWVREGRLGRSVRRAEFELTLRVGGRRQLARAHAQSESLEPRMAAVLDELLVGLIGCWLMRAVKPMPQLSFFGG